MWNYSGWDTPSTCLGETKAPEHAFRRALFLALPVIAVAYVLPVGGAARQRRHRLVEVGHGCAAGLAAAAGGPGSGTPSRWGPS